MSAKKLTVLSLYTALALIIFMVESALPALAPLPFAKIGLANIITLVVLVYYSPGDAALVFFMRVFLSSLFMGQMVYLWYSLAGGFVCFCVEWLINVLLKGKHVYITSVFGALGHNLGQILVAVLLMGKVVLVYLPYMLVIGCVTGIFNGIAANTLVSQMRKLKI